ncbi:hypothetical protein RND81_13G128400 [Saponaria officinalis]|uniref:Uncharacterized protein n=1 Tax=Saponaria officinalis TaxID=3572 RepID=A0AAW1GX55_SAPOF
MVDPDKARPIIGMIGRSISFGLFLSSTCTELLSIKNKSIRKFHVDPYIATILNCVMWVTYGVPQVNPDHFISVLHNSFGLAIEIIYVLIFFYFSVDGCLTRKKIICGVIFEVIFTVIIVFITFILRTITTRTVFVGTLCVSFNILMYFSPLTVVKQVIKTKSVKYMPF